MEKKSMPAAELSNVAALRLYLASGVTGKTVNLKELKALTKDERDELGELAREELIKDQDRTHERGY